MITWVNVLTSALVTLLGVGGVSWFLARSQRRHYDAESGDLRASADAKRDQQINMALDRADRCLQRQDQLERHIDVLEATLREHGIPVPAMPAALPWPAPRTTD